MTHSIVAAYESLVDAMAVFNARWPSLVIDGTVWKLPLLSEQKTPAQIPVDCVTGPSAIAAAVSAFREFELDVGQSPGTVMRLPGYFILRESVLDEVRAVNRCKAELVQAIEAERLLRNVAVSRRSNIMRQALGSRFSLNQLKRTLQDFDAAPRQITFTWAGHTSGKERVQIGPLRERLLEEARSRAEQVGEALEQTPQWFDLRALVNMADDDYLDMPKPVAPHPRCMLWFSKSSRYDAMLHVNLPFFVLEGKEPPKIVGLKDFDREARSAQRPDIKLRIPALPGGRLFVPSKPDARVTAKQDGHGTAEIQSTYRKQLE
ncbi:DNA replication terminus site-binding protein [Pseudomonas capeferrum]|uniref:DNA replication terminus site-binding protein n=1 Tax=Pseudomonas capeferrum TaxID=1495066 RepID=UPI0015E46B09|nr:DNA replication terminus site-binding protein [Pseudomonas capeferrum]MBA1204154.1 DNA replication terminus site-binding protein [Pseudomonas capeferrum]